MERFSRQCRCARAIARSCCRCCCSQFQFRRCWAWWREQPRFLPARTRRIFTSCCFSPTMWCLLQLVWHYLGLSSTPNEASFSYPFDYHGSISRLCVVSGARGRPGRCAAGRGLSDHLLPRALCLDGVSAVLHQLHCFHSIPGKGQSLDSECSQVGSDRDWGDRSRCDFPASGAADASDWDAAECGCNDGVDDSSILFSDRLAVPGRAARCARGHLGGGGSSVLHHRTGDGTDLGAAGVGNLVGARRYPPDLDVGVVADLCQLSCAAALLEQRADTDAGGGACCIWRAGCTAGLFLDLVFPHAASAAGDRRRWIDGSSHAANVADQLAGISLLCVPHLLVALPA